MVSAAWAAPTMFFGLDSGPEFGTLTPKPIAVMSEAPKTPFDTIGIMDT